jgi:hypothetical protein
LCSSVHFSLTRRSGQFCFSGFVCRWISACRRRVYIGLLCPVLIWLLSPAGLSSPFFAQPVSTSREPLALEFSSFAATVRRSDRGVHRQDLIFCVLRHRSRIPGKLVFVLCSARQLGSPLIRPVVGLLPVLVLGLSPRLWFLLQDLGFSVKLVDSCLCSLVSIVCLAGYRSSVLSPVGHAAGLLFCFPLPLANPIWFHRPTRANCFCRRRILASVPSHATFISKVQLLIQSFFLLRA